LTSFGSKAGRSERVSAQFPAVHAVEVAVRARRDLDRSVATVLTSADAQGFVQIVQRRDLSGVVVTVSMDEVGIDWAHYLAFYLKLNTEGKGQGDTS
jgi:hypothetical protein